MPVMSYLAYPVAGRQEDLQTAIQQIPQCSLIRAQNRELYVVVTETESTEEEEQLQEKLRAIAALQCMVLVSGFSNSTEKSQ